MSDPQHLVGAVDDIFVRYGRDGGALIPPAAIPDVCAQIANYRDALSCRGIRPEAVERAEQVLERLSRIYAAAASKESLDCDETDRDR